MTLASSFAIAWLSTVFLAAAPAQVGSALIEQALAEPTRIVLKDVTLRDALVQVAEQTGVRIVMAPEVMALAPQGGDTVIERVEIPGVPLGEGLARLFAPLGMTFVVGDGFVEIVPLPAFRCLGRAPTWRELDTVGALGSWQPGIDDEALAKLRKRVQFQVDADDGWARLADAVRGVGAGRGDEVLTIACARLGWVWCPIDDRIVITGVTDLVRRQLARPVSLRLNSRPLIEILQALSDKVGVEIRADVGVIRSLPLHLQKSASLNVSFAPAERVLDRIAAETGLGYLIEAGGVLFYQPRQRDPSGGDTHAPADPVSGDPYVGKIVVPLEDGTTVEWLIRFSELPPDLRHRRAEDLKNAFESLRGKAKTP